MDASRDLAHGCIRAALRLQRARGAIGLTGPIDDGPRLSDVAARLREAPPFLAQRVAFGTAILISRWVPLEVTAGQRSVIALSPVPDRHMRLDLLAIDHPTEHLGSAIVHQAGIDGEPFT